MYYLIINILGVERCIDKNRNDIYRDDQTYNCHADNDFRKKTLIREINIYCNEFPDDEIVAKVYSD